MATNEGLQKFVSTIKDLPQQVIRYISGAVIRIFGPTDDNYPATGVQPYEGDPTDEKSSS